MQRSSRKRSRSPEAAAVPGEPAQVAQASVSDSGSAAAEKPPVVEAVKTAPIVPVSQSTEDVRFFVVTDPSLVLSHRRKATSWLDVL